ncbi:Lysosomal Pro-X carboxypeptidase [Armadillidium vulgare]|nr:Lysosomal Pro-X carboxypeptidase [Armadillidium vulgare]
MKIGKLCRPLKNKEDLSYLKEFLTNVYGNLAMADYPYPASFLAPLPANPIMRVCEYLKHPNFDSTNLLVELFNGISVYFNYTKTARCLDHTKDASSLLGDEGWDFQACTEMVMPFCYDGKSDFFEPTPWNFTEYSEMCYSKWKVMPRPLMPEIQYGGSKITAASNIVFSNGLLDPWSTGGVLKNLTDSLIAVIIPEGAHHLDLRESDPNDPPSVIEARKIEKHFITKWINDANRMRKEVDKEFEKNSLSTKNKIKKELDKEFEKKSLSENMIK